jgi:hypothetical protein
MNMSIAKLIQAQVETFTNINKSFANKVGPETFEKRIIGIIEAREKQIAVRINALEAQKIAEAAHYDAAIKVEKPNDARIEILKTRKIAALARLDEAIKVEEKVLTEVKARRIDPKPKPKKATTARKATPKSKPKKATKAHKATPKSKRKGKDK